MRWFIGLLGCGAVNSLAMFVAAVVAFANAIDDSATNEVVNGAKFGLLAFVYAIMAGAFGFITVVCFLMVGGKTYSYQTRFSSEQGDATPIREYCGFPIRWLGYATCKANVATMCCRPDSSARNNE